MEAMRKATFAAAVVVAGALPAQAGTVTEITFAQLVRPQVLDFESASDGAISGTSTVFTSSFLTQVTATSSGAGSGDTYNNFAPSTRGLFVQGGSLILGTRAGNPAIDDNAAFTLDLEIPFTQFGFEVLDQIGDDYTLTFFRSGGNVGAITFNYPVANLVRYFENTEAFDRVVITSTAAGNAYGVDNLTVGNPEPGTMALFGLGALAIGGLVVRRRRQRRARA
jgi:hypothetical protein